MEVMNDLSDAVKELSHKDAFTAWREIYLVCDLDFGVKQLQSGAGEDCDTTELWSKVRPGSSGEAQHANSDQHLFQFSELEWERSSSHQLSQR